MQKSINKVMQVTHGFKPIEFEAKNIYASNSVQNTMNIAMNLYNDDRYQIRCLAVFLLGFIACDNPEALKVMKTNVSKDLSWQVQEILAKAFDQFCMDNGYEQSLPVIEVWLDDQNPKVCRAVTEGLRIWTNRPFFKEHPELAIQHIAQHKNNSSEYLRKSVGNALRDIYRKHQTLVEKEISTWDLENKRVKFTYGYVLKNKK